MKGAEPKPMNTKSRRFRTVDILLLVLAALVIGLGYYKFVLQPINSKISDYRSMESELQLEYEQNQIKAARMSMMQKEIQKAQAKGIRRTVAAYDNSVNLMPELYGIMRSANDYSLDSYSWES